VSTWLTNARYIAGWDAKVDSPALGPDGVAEEMPIRTRPVDCSIRTETFVGHERAIDAEGVERMRGVVAAHLNSSAFRKAPLAFTWSKGA